MTDSPEKDPLQTLLDEADQQFQNGRWEKARDLYEKVLEQNPESAHAHNKIGAILAQRGDAAAAEERFHKALEIDPKYAQALSNLGNIYFTRGDYHGALAKYDAALAINPDSAVFMQNRAAALKKLGRIDESVSALKKAQTLDRRYARTEARAQMKSRFGCLLPILALGALLVAAVSSG